MHAAASLVAFTSLPLAALRLAAQHEVTWRRIAAWARHTARACLCCLAPMGLAVVPIVLSVPVPFPFGLIQRMTGLLAVALLLLLAGWAWSAAIRPVDEGRAHDVPSATCAAASSAGRLLVHGQLPSIRAPHVGAVDQS